MLELPATRGTPPPPPGATSPANTGPRSRLAPLVAARSTELSAARAPFLGIGAAIDSANRTSRAPPKKKPPDARAAPPILRGIRGRRDQRGSMRINAACRQ